MVSESLSGVCVFADSTAFVEQHSKHLYFTTRLAISNEERYHE
ncbi:hypothetical protein BCIN_01g02940 [Botrytis cinerea B05.10]|uniref:Uncharacterized protein n=1 Tax=Botryotinia fuckeliana (strain B05.10) TaxID=332648 RepID=A0A384J4T5_BOTFB|nr:hypothetical protein BCIN_01g02940 [Botrytis cinerea B05.10]ATZ45527.1 hypothetical protein BCIN_01g02940 [Botrytis cinerea B05.10]